MLIVFSYSFAGYEINKQTINSGGEKMFGGSYEMVVSIAQVDASVIQANGNYTLNGGFWQSFNDFVFEDGFE